MTRVIIHLLDWTLYQLDPKGYVPLLSRGTRRKR